MAVEARFLWAFPFPEDAEVRAVREEKDPENLEAAITEEALCDAVLEWCNPDPFPPRVSRESEPL